MYVALKTSTNYETYPVMTYDFYLFYCLVFIPLFVTAYILERLYLCVYGVLLIILGTYVVYVFVY